MKLNINNPEEAEALRSFIDDISTLDKREEQQHINDVIDRLSKSERQEIYKKYPFSPMKRYYLNRAITDEKDKELYIFNRFILSKYPHQKRSYIELKKANKASLCELDDLERLAFKYKLESYVNRIEGKKVK